MVFKLSPALESPEELSEKTETLQSHLEDVTLHCGGDSTATNTTEMPKRELDRTGDENHKGDFLASGQDESTVTITPIMHTLM